MDTRKCLNYFVVDGRKYYTGTVFKVKYYGEIVDSVFVCTYFASHVYIVYKILKCGTQNNTPIDMFKEKFVCVTDTVDAEAKPPQEKHLKDNQINGMLNGWALYIFLMAIATIFKENIGLWILISVVFFSWRYNKIKNEGTYIDW